MEKILTLCMVLKDDELLLGMKKRGFGAGHYNGFGGKVEKGESIEAAARRELKEEAGIEATELHVVGKLSFTFATGSDPLCVHVYRVDQWQGDPVETEEMCPEWFALADIPYAKMWSDDIYWLPKLLEGQSFAGTFHFDAPASASHAATILTQHIETVAPAELA